jgi:hypothetical protein
MRRMLMLAVCLLAPGSAAHAAPIVHLTASITPGTILQDDVVFVRLTLTNDAASTDPLHIANKRDLAIGGQYGLVPAGFGYDDLHTFAFGHWGTTNLTLLPGESHSWLFGQFKPHIPVQVGSYDGAVFRAFVAGSFYIVDVPAFTVDAGVRRAITPEPASLGLLALGLVPILRRRFAH